MVMRVTCKIKQSCKFKANENILFSMCIKRFYKAWTDWNFFKWYVYEFSIDHSSITKEDILNIHQYLMVKNYTK